jgi:hypothetical protein
MSGIERRISKLEEEGGIGRVLVIGRPRDMTDAQLEAYLHARGISTTPEDLTISLKRLSAGEQSPWISVDGKLLTDAVSQYSAQQ